MIGTVLVVDDKEMMRDSIGATLSRAGFSVMIAKDGQGAIEQIAKRRPDAIVSDLRMPGMTGIELARSVRQFDEDLPVIVMTAFGTIDTAVEAMREGAFDYITKPFEGDELVIALKRGIQHAGLQKENRVLRAAANPRPAGDGPIGLERVIGQGPAMRRVKEQAAAVAGSQGTVLICGESGTGKEVVARAIHELSPRARGPFLAVNCAALSESLLESELFGHEKGAFTGADKLRKGRFELADGGTLLLDEVSEITPGLQAKLLRVLQERSFERVGSSRAIGVDVRIIATSNRDLPKSVASGDFRQDLFFRLNVLPVHLPPLRERPEDVGSLAKHFVGRVTEREGGTPVRLHPHAEALLRRYPWPGNVRELQNICERAVVISAARPAQRDPDGTPIITPELIQPWLAAGQAMPVQSSPSVMVNANPEPANGAHAGLADEDPGAGIGDIPAGMTMADIEREVIVATLKRYDGHRQKTARSLGIGVRTLGLKLKKWKEERLVATTL